MCIEKSLLIKELLPVYHLQNQNNFIGVFDPEIYFKILTSYMFEF